MSLPRTHSERANRHLGRTHTKRTLVVIAIAGAIILSGSSVAAAAVITPSEISTTPWWTLWDQRVSAAGGLTIDLLTEAREQIDQEQAEQIKIVVLARKSRVVPVAPDDLLALIQTYFQPEDVERAMRVSWCESHYNAAAKNPHSTASGLFQHLRGWWGGSWGYPAFDPFDPVQSVKAAAWLVYNTRSGWENWYPSKPCWRL